MPQSCVPSEPLIQATSQGAGGISRDNSTGTWRIQHHARARLALADPHLGVVREADVTVAPNAGRAPSAAEFLASWFSRRPRAHHQEVRRHLVKPYGEKSLAGSEALLRTVASECAADLPADCDLVRDYLKPFVLRGMARLLAVPEGQQELLAKVVTTLSAVLERPWLDAQASRAVDNCILYLRALLEHLLALMSPPPMIQALGGLVGPPPRGGIWPAVSTLAQLLTAGFHPTVTGAALTWRTLHAHPGLLTEVGRGAMGLADIGDEVLRLQPPFPLVHRWVHERCECLGVVLEPGAHVLVDLQAVNRDPAVFERPDEFVPGRDRRLSLSFSHGPHRCLGEALARLLLSVALNTLMSLQPTMRPVATTADAGLPRTGHLMVVRALPCRREHAGG